MFEKVIATIIFTKSCLQEWSLCVEFSKIVIFGEATSVARGKNVILLQNTECGFS